MPGELPGSTRLLRALRAAAAALLIPVFLFVEGCTVTNGVVAGVRNAVWPRDKRTDYKYAASFGVEDPQFRRTIDSIADGMVDGIFATIGSINLDSRSMAINAEESLSFYDRPFAEQMEAMFQGDKALSREISHAEWKHRGFAARSAEWISWIWEPYY